LPPNFWWHSVLFCVILHHCSLSLSLYRILIN
jgi:hypothetical protein